MWTSSSSASRPLSSSTSTRSPSPYNTTSSNSRLPPAGKTMEEVWKDINLASDLPHDHHHRGVILQDFFSKIPAPPTAASTSSPPPAPPAPPTMLTLSSATHHFSSLLLQPHHHQQQHVSFLNMPFDSARKKFPEFQPSSGERRHKRMIKNRESAARSRARKQAYTNELELEVAHLLEENARLKEQQEQLYRAAAVQHQRRKPLHRTLTAPF